MHLTFSAILILAAKAFTMRLKAQRVGSFYFYRIINAFAAKIKMRIAARKRLSFFCLFCHNITLIKN